MSDVDTVVRAMSPAILLATELGSGHGHLAPLRAAAEHLRTRGLRCVFAVHQPEAAESLRLHEFGPVLAAPQGHAGAEAVAVQASYASLLHNCGFHRATALGGRLRIWRTLMQLGDVRAVLVDHAPTALLAARSLGLPAATLGVGFSLPPLHAPFPAYPGRVAEPAVLRGNEEKVLAVVQAALAAVGAAPLNDLQALFADVYTGLITYPELDHYGTERPQAYLGLPDFSAGLRVNWMTSPAPPRVLAYLRPGPQLEPLLQALSDSPVQVLVRLMDIAAHTLSRYQRPGMVLTDQNIWLRQALESCDAFVCSGSHGAVAEALLAGKPCLLQHVHWEQRLLAEQVQRHGAGVVLDDDPQAPLQPALARLLEDHSLRTAAQGFAQRYAGQDRHRILPDWLDRWQALRSI